MLELDKTLNLIKGAILDPKATWASYYEENRTWQQTAWLLTGPLIVGAYLLQLIFSSLFRSGHMFGSTFGFEIFVRGMVSSIAMFVILTLIINFAAGQMKGKANYNRAFAAASLAAVPAYIGTAISSIMWIGGMIGLGLSIYSLVLLYQMIPQYLEVPEGSRVPHFIVTIVGTFVAGAVIAGMLGFGRMM